VNRISDPVIPGRERMALKTITEVVASSIRMTAISQTKLQAFFRSFDSPAAIFQERCRALSLSISTLAESSQRHNGGSAFFCHHRLGRQTDVRRVHADVDSNLPRRRPSPPGPFNIDNRVAACLCLGSQNLMSRRAFRQFAKPMSVPQAQRQAYTQTIEHDLCRGHVARSVS